MSTLSGKNLKEWQKYVSLFSDAFKQGQEIAPGEVHCPSCDNKGVGPEKNDRIKKAQKEVNFFSVSICSPHPDDECLTGALPLRLLCEQNIQVFNLAVTLGSDSSRRGQRRKELENACEVLGFQNRIAGGDFGLDNVRTDVRHSFPDLWRKNVDSIVEHFFQVSPALVVMPHKGDSHPTHEGTNVLVSEALSIYTREAKIDIVAVENEFWFPITSPNLLVGLSNEDLSLLVAALSQHTGEISRNPYHLWMPARMMDNLRRGWELVRGCHEKTPDFCFAELYRVCLYCQGEKKKWPEENTVFSPQQKIDLLR